MYFQVFLKLFFACKKSLSFPRFMPRSDLGDGSPDGDLQSDIARVLVDWTGMSA